MFINFFFNEQFFGEFLFSAKTIRRKKFANKFAIFFLALNLLVTFFSANNFLRKYFGEKQLANFLIAEKSFSEFFFGENVFGEKKSGRIFFRSKLLLAENFFGRPDDVGVSEGAGAPPVKDLSRDCVLRQKSRQGHVRKQANWRIGTLHREAN